MVVTSTGATAALRNSVPLGPVRVADPHHDADTTSLVVGGAPLCSVAAVDGSGAALARVDPRTRHRRLPHTLDGTATLVEAALMVTVPNPTGPGPALFGFPVTAADTTATGVALPREVLELYLDGGVPALDLLGLLTDPAPEDPHDPVPLTEALTSVRASLDLLR